MPIVAAAAAARPSLRCAAAHAGALREITKSAAVYVRVSLAITCHLPGPVCDGSLVGPARSPGECANALPFPTSIKTGGGYRWPVSGPTTAQLDYFPFFFASMFVSLNGVDA